MITDWDDAYANRAHVPDASSIIDRWAPDAAAFREDLGERAELDVAYADGPRCLYDLFWPDGEAKGLAVFLHGGYWLLFDKSYWSHFAAGPLAHGWAVAVPSYPVAPRAWFPDITASAARAVEHAAARVPGPIRLAGHSAGGHLVARLMTTDGPLRENVLAHLERVIPISGLFDLRPMLRLTMNEDWQLDLPTALAESPAMQMPAPGVTVKAWVGGAERPEFLRQTALLVNAWTGCGADIEEVQAPGLHHFDVIDGLKSAEHPLTRSLVE